MLGNRDIHRTLAPQRNESRFLLSFVVRGFDVNVALTVDRDINLLH